MSLNYLFNAMKSAGQTVEVQYRRGGECLATLSAIRGKTEEDILDEDTTINAVTDDWIVLAADLVDASQQPIVPKTADRIVLIATGQNFEVLPTRRNGPVYRKSDPAGKLLRIHTKEVS